MNKVRFKMTLIAHEGYKRYVYDDATGVGLMRGGCLEGHPSIGVGRNLHGKGLSDSEILLMLDNDIHDVEIDLQGLTVAHDLDDVRREVLGNMIFNMGIRRVLGFKKMLAALENRDYGLAAVEMLDSRWAKQVGYRARYLAMAMRTGSFE